MPDTVELYVKRVDLIIQNDANLEAEQAQSDLDSLSRSKLSSTYAKDRAGINVDIAEARAAIADINVTLHGDIDPDQKAAMKLRTYEIKAQIAQYNIDNSNLKLGFEIVKAKG